jgi:hypothetical protein
MGANRETNMLWSASCSVCQGRARSLGVRQRKLMRGGTLRQVVPVRKRVGAVMVLLGWDKGVRYKRYTKCRHAVRWYMRAACFDVPHGSIVQSPLGSVSSVPGRYHGSMMGL